MQQKLRTYLAGYRRIWRFLLWFILSLLLLLAMIAGLTRALGASLAERYQSQVITSISQQLALPVSVGSLTMDWYGLNPELVLNDIQIQDGCTPSSTLLTVKYFALRISVLDSLLQRRWMLKALVLNHVTVAPQFYQQFNQLSSGSGTKKLPWDKLWIDVKDLNTQVKDKLPGLKSFNIRIQLHEQQGQFVLKDDAWTLSTPWLFRAPLQLSDTDIEGRLKLGKHAWFVAIDKGRVSLPEGQLTLQLSLRVPKVGGPSINLDARGRFNQLTRQSVYNYMPISVLSPGLLHWLDTSILGVDSAQSHFVLKGRMADFPFVNKPGEFLVDSNLQGAALAFADDWPKASNVNARMVFSGQSMLITAKQGQFAGLDMNGASVAIPVMAVGQPVVLNVNTQVEDDAAKIVKAIDVLPITSIAHIGRMLNAQGPMTVALQLSLPLENTDTSQFTLAGTAHLQQVNLQSKQAVLAKLNGLTGILHFSNEGLSTSGIKGQWQGMPVTITLKTTETGATLANAILMLDTQKLKPLLPPAWATTLKGQTRLGLRAIASLADVPKVVLYTEGQGMAINLPAPFNKPATSKIATELALQHQGDNHWSISGHYGADVNLQAALASVKQQTQLAGLALGWGSQATLTPGQISVTLNQKAIDLTPWITLIQQQLPSKQTTNSILPLNLQVVTPQLTLAGYRLTDVNARSSYQNNQFNTTLVSKEINGSINYQLPNAKSKEQLQINLKQLVLPSNSLGSSQATSWQRFPPTQFSCQYLQVGKLSLGQVNVVLTPMNGGLTISQGRMTTKAITVNASGSWLWQSAKTQLTGTLNTGNLAQALQDLGLGGNMAANSAQAAFNLSWPGAPWQMSPSALQGTASLTIGSGKITGLSQSTDASVGLGKLISLLSIEGLMRIGDLPQEGFAFDKVTGQFQFNQGNMQVIQSEIKGVIADLSFQGQIGLAQKNYNLNMQVVGRLTSSLPVVATIAGGPVVGAVTWVVNKAVGPAVDKISSSSYRITGSWQKPVITKASSYEKK